MPPQEFVDLVAVVRGYQRSRAVTVAAELGIADLLREGPLSIEDLAATTKTDLDALYRLLRALASIAVFHESSSRRFALTAMGDYLRSDHPLSVGPLARTLGADYEWRVWAELLHSVRTGESAAVATLGMDVWQYRKENSYDGDLFDAAMRAFSRSEGDALVTAYDFGRHKVIADIGGGTGAALAAILRATPGPRGILFDQPHVVAGANEQLDRAGLTDRVDIISGDFFESVPAGADAYVLRRILHDWDDDDAVKILRCVHRSMQPDARLLIVDAIVGPPNDDPLTKFLDLMMLVSEGGRERTEAEWAALIDAGGYNFLRASRATANSHVIEATPR
jgi:SAM-dependent methyltransferase